MELELRKRIEDLYSRSHRTNQLTATSFLDPAETAQAKIVIRHLTGVNALFYGGYEGAERMRLFFLPDYLDEEFFPYDEYLSAILVKCPYGSPTHRDYLGSLMGLGIKRETIGDILVFNGYTYIICTPTIASFIADNLIKVGKFGVKCELCELSQVKAPEPVFDAVTGTVASLRADAVTAVAFNISRTTAAELIKEGRLSLNHLEELSTSREIEVGNLLSLRGYGRAKLAELGGMSRKGRQFIKLHVFSKK
ncbi:MAG: RNA-binding protein [Ruminococcaceae bacterium]|nr:RNA-binding protein [Oscillospiraceae bacterium]